MGQIYEITPFTLLDYPDELACIVWLSGCNLRCVYCHNPEIVLKRGNKEEWELISFLEARRGKLTGVVFSGGEATHYPNLPGLMKKVRDMGFKIKLDTNGSSPEVIHRIVSEKLVHHIALDYKSPPHLAEKITGTARFNAAFSETLDFLIDACRAGNVVLEVRTTVPFDYMNEADIGWMIEDLDHRGYQGTYWLQNVVTNGEKTLGNIAAVTHKLNPALLAVPKNFKLGYRNFAGLS
jgi:pyruvate formate lyase activating enzyme